MNMNPVKEQRNNSEAESAFLRELVIPNCIVQAGSANKVDILLTPENAVQYLETHPNKDLYFLTGVDPQRGMERARDEDVRMKSGFFLDFDLRVQYPEYSDADIKEIGYWLEGALADHPYLSHWRYIIFTGNGLHVHYCGDPISLHSPEQWRDGIRYILGEVERHTKMEPDKGCVNAARLCRIPGSFNNKESRHTRTEILLSRPDNKMDISLVEKFGKTASQTAVSTSAGKESEKKWKEGLEGVGKGKRNEAAASVAGRILHDLAEELWETVGWGGMKEWNAKNTPPLPEKELRIVFDSIVERESKNRGEEDDDGNKRRSQADKLIELVTQDNATLFHDQFQEPHAHIRVGDHWQTWRIKSKLFRRWLCALLWEQEQKAAHSNAITSALNILEGRACFQGERIALENRVTWQGDAIWYDLSNEEWSAVRITKEGWTIEAAPPVLFRRQMHQQPQVQPISGGKMEEVLEFFNLAEGEQPLLLLVYIVSCFLPDIPHPVPILHGPQGAAKTTFARILRRLIDPSSVEVLSMPNVPNDLIQLLSHHWFAFFDNVTGLPEWASDALCRAVTGEGFSKRELYTDDDDVIYAFRRCVGLNGINLAAKKPDLLDRSILFRLERIAKERRQEERVLWRRFDEARPRILGAIFDALAGALRLREEIVLSGVPRMADFTYWGCAIARALGYAQDEFLRVYYDNIDEQHQEAIEGNVVATVILVLMEERQRWTGSASELLKELCDIAEHEKIGTHTSSWPKSVNVLGRRLNEVKTNLAEANILIDSRKGTGGRRIITIERAPVAVGGGETETSVPGVSPDSPPEHSASESQEGNSGESGDISTALPF